MPFFFALVLSLFFFTHVISSLVYPNLHGNKRLGGGGILRSSVVRSVPIILISVHTNLAMLFFFCLTLILTCA
jgi:hypothetical protein